ncbi:MAG: hypothetical protein ACR2NP_07780 [Pirellulaceae bacterium]
MLPRNLSDGPPSDSLAWDDLTRGIPTIAALAGLCSQMLASSQSPAVDMNELPAESRAILFAAGQTGALGIQGDKNAFEPGERYLAVCVELGEGRRLEFRCPENPEQTIRFMEGFRRLCQSGLVMHQLMNEFSLTAAGFDAAREIDANEVQSLIDMGRDGV